MSQPNISKWLKQATNKLKAAGIGTARLDALVLLEDATQQERSWLIAHPEFELPQDVLELLNIQIERRATHEPLAYIRGFTEFYGRKFYIDSCVLEPRPESEAMVEQLKKLQLPPYPKIADIGTGSGALGITAALELPGSHVTLVDIDFRCLGVAERNARQHKVDAFLLEGNLAEPIKKADVLLCNLPYVPDDHTINEAAMHEPKIAIFGGKNGLDLYRKLFDQLKTKPIPYVLTESLPFQHAELSKLAQDAGYTQVTKDDFIQVFKRN